MAKKNWLITGISSGIGKALAEAVLAKGDFVIGSFRKKEQAESFNQQYKGKGYAFVLDITDGAGMATCIQNVHNRFGAIDVLVNNAGYGLLGAIEELSIEEARAQMETNFFGTLQMTKSVLPIMRKQKKGMIIQISSASGIRSTPGFGLYNASKFALEGFSEALAGELKPLGISVMLVEPGPFRTAFAGYSLVQAKERIADYESTAGRFRMVMMERNGRQDGDPVKAAAAIIAAANAAIPPLRLVLGKSAMENVNAKIADLQRDMREWESVSVTTSFD